MLTTLRIKNLALVSDLTLELQPGFNAITGETGAGKSIIIGALNLVLGERADRALIRSGNDNCSVEAVFDTKQHRAPLKKILEENGLEPCEENQLVLKRTFSAIGTNRQFINGSPTTLNILALFGEWLVDMHGPHDHQSLLHPAKQLLILDAFGELEKTRENFSEIVRRRSAVEAEKSKLIVDEKTYAQQLDLLRFQVQEIFSAQLQVDEENELQQEHRRASNAAKLVELSQTALLQLSEDENSLMAQAGKLGRTMQELQRVDPSAGCLLSLHEQAVAGLRDVQSDLSHYADRLEINPEHLAALGERLNLLQSLKRKYGVTMEEVIAFGEEAQKKLKNLEQRDAELSRINSELKKLDTELYNIGHELSAARRKLIPKLAKAVVAQLNDLGFHQCHFDISICSQNEGSFTAPLSSGFDTIEFQFAPNVGEPARPLRAIASSGEMSRVMLALKTALALQDEIPLLVFDEIDANVGGQTASVVGEKMRQIAEQHQVICITHLPAVAASASAHYLVSKEIVGSRTISKIELLERSERITEIARMFGGQSEVARQHAKALLGGK
ncbi:MAG: DNA repair protein RecN [Verrucomicrobiota bacterium]